MTVPGSIDALLLGGQGGYQIERSLRFNSADSAYLSRTFGGSATSLYTYTISAWVKRSNSGGVLENIFGVGTGSAIQTSWLGFNSDTLALFFNDGTAYVASSALYRDPSAWYHIVATVDTTQATASNRVKLYVNGTQITALSSASYPAQNTGYQINAGFAHQIGARYRTSIDSYFNGYITEFYFIDGQALTPSSFGETNPATGVWQPKKYTGTYGANGFYLKFADNSGTTSTTLGKDSSGNGNNWTPNNFSVTAGAGNDSLLDTPTPYADGGNGRGNYATWNPIAGSMPISNGALYAYNPYAYYPAAFGTIKIGTNFSPIYWEGIVDGGTSQSSGVVWGLTAGDSSVTGAGIYGSFTDGGNSLVYSSNGGILFYPGGITAGTILQFAFNPSTGNIWLGKNNVWYNSSGGSTGNPATGANPTTTISGTALTPYVQAYVNGLNVNFGQRAFAYTPPSGFLALNTQNLPEPSIKKPSSYMDVKLYTGTAGTLTVTGLGFSPDLVWIKGRNAATTHVIQDTVRGATAYLSSNSTAAENTNTANDWFRAFTSDGFTVAATTSGGTPTSEWNNNGSTYVAWCWDESATPGFDIVTYTGTGSATTVAHTLGVAPSMIIVKRRTGAIGEWWVYHSVLGATKGLALNSTSAEQTSSLLWNNTAPTSSVFSLGTGSDVNASSGTYVAYLWSEVAGFSKLGSYTGNGSSDGPFVYCGFKPRWILIKRTDSTSNWGLIDTSRDTYNAAVKFLNPDLASAEGVGFDIDILSNGFKQRTAGGYNGSGATYIYAAFAESPFKYSLAR